MQHNVAGRMPGERDYCLAFPIVLADCWFSAMSLLGLLATWIPAQRALSIDPMILLREQ
jgi:ABC-type antimicrobial peptide transport system permease subunit